MSASESQHNATKNGTEEIENAPAAQRTAERKDGKKSKQEKKSGGIRLPKSLRRAFGKKNAENGSATSDRKKAQKDAARPDDAVSVGCTGRMRRVFKKSKTPQPDVDKQPRDKEESTVQTMESEETVTPRFVGESQSAKQQSAAPVQFVEKDYAFKEKLEKLVKNNLVGVGLVDHAAACTFNGQIAANCPSEYQPTVEQIRHILHFLSESSDESPIGQTFTIDNVEYVCCELVEGAYMCGKRSGDEAGCPSYETPMDGGICINTTKSHLVFGAYEAAQSSTHHDDVKAMMAEICKVLRD